jgi:hypothetical protein
VVGGGLARSDQSNVVPIEAGRFDYGTWILLKDGATEQGSRVGRTLFDGGKVIQSEAILLERIGA